MRYMTSPHACASADATATMSNNAVVVSRFMAVSPSTIEKDSLQRASSGVGIAQIRRGRAYGFGGYRNENRLGPAGIRNLEVKGCEQLLWIRICQARITVD